MYYWNKINNKDRKERDKKKKREMKRKITGRGILTRRRELKTGSRKIG